MTLVIVWLLLSLSGILRAAWLWREAVLDRRAIADDANGRRLLAHWQVEHAWQGVIIYICLFVAGVTSLLFRTGVIELWTSKLVTPMCLVVALVVLVVRQERDAEYRLRTIGRRGRR